MQLVRHYAAWGAGVMSPLAHPRPPHSHTHLLTQGYDTDIALSYPFHVQDPLPSITLRGLNKIHVSALRSNRWCKVFFFFKRRILFLFLLTTYSSRDPPPHPPFSLFEESRLQFPNCKCVQKRSLGVKGGRIWIFLPIFSISFFKVANLFS